MCAGVKSGAGAGGRGEARARVVIVGGGAGGLAAARRLARGPVDVTLVDRTNYHLFQPLLYQVATGALSPGDIASPLRTVLRRLKNTTVLQAEVTGFDLLARRVLTSGGELAYDHLIVAAGVVPHYFGHPEWGAQALGLKSLDDGLTTRRAVLSAFEQAELETDPERRREWLTFVVVGAGPTGVEMAGALAELASRTLPGEFRGIDPREARIVLLEGAARVLPLYEESLSASARESLERLGIEVRTEAMVEEIAEGVTVVRTAGRAEPERIAGRTVLWAAGMRASPLGEALARAAGVEPGPGGRVTVGADLSLPGHPEIFVVGDLAHLPPEHGGPLPGVAAAAMQGGRFAAERILGRRGEGFQFRERGSLAVIGRNAAVGTIGRLRLKGPLAWLAWSAVHLLFLVEFQNQVLVLMQWAWSYLTGARGARLITGSPPAVDRRGAPSDPEPLKE